jgi:hypothetical protein
MYLCIINRQASTFSKYFAKSKIIYGLELNTIEHSRRVRLMIIAAGSNRLFPCLILS